MKTSRIKLMKPGTTLINKPFTPINTYKIVSVAVLLAAILFITGFYLIQINHATDTYPRAQADVVMVLVIAVIGLGLFQFWALPQRPLAILIWFIPSLSGMAAAFFLYALSHQSVEIMTICCASLILAAASNYGGIYILMRTYFDAAKGLETARELRAIGVMFAALTGFAFVCLSFTDIAVFKELGELAATSIVLTILFVHTVFPKLITSQTLPIPLNSPLYSMCVRFGATGKRSALFGAVFTIGMLIYLFQGIYSNPHWAALNFKLLAFVAFGLTGLIFFFFFDWKLTLLAVTPAFFAILNLSGLMQLTGGFTNSHISELLIIVMGIGMSYALFFIRSFQRYGGNSHPAFKLTTLAVFIGLTLIIGGCAVLGLTHHPMLQSAGIFLSLGFLFNLIGIFIFLPAVSAYLFRPAPIINYSVNPDANQTLNRNSRVLRRYKHSEAYPRLFAGFKLRCDTMFSELPALLEPCRTIRTIIDIGCGYGVPAAWLLERFPQATVYGIDPDRIRVRVASLILQTRGVIKQNLAPAVPAVESPADIALMFDMIHFLNDAELKLTLKRLHRNLRPGALLIVRAAIPPTQQPSKIWRFENFKHRLFKVSPCYRTADVIHNHIIQAGFTLEQKASSGSIGELVWFIAKSVS
ncbi:methyltransferase domain-containing protein [Desulfococcaceae bacterium HSG9]|nr:methyltransferase domain-containing protein [Desulfococcaceae bacterium HSG9]